MGITPWRTLESSWERRLHRPLEIDPVLHVLVAFMCRWMRRWPLQRSMSAEGRFWLFGQTFRRSVQGNMICA